MKLLKTTYNKIRLFWQTILFNRRYLMRMAEYHQIPYAKLKKIWVEENHTEHFHQVYLKPFREAVQRGDVTCDIHTAKGEILVPKAHLTIVNPSNQQDQKTADQFLTLAPILGLKDHQKFNHYIGAEIPLQIFLGLLSVKEARALVVYIVTLLNKKTFLISQKAKHSEWDYERRELDQLAFKLNLTEPVIREFSELIFKNFP